MKKARNTIPPLMLTCSPAFTVKEVKNQIRSPQCRRHTGTGWCEICSLFVLTFLSLCLCYSQIQFLFQNKTQEAYSYILASLPSEKRFFFFKKKKVFSKDCIFRYSKLENLPNVFSQCK